jgi:hypothetical protein
MYHDMHCRLAAPSARCMALQAGLLPCIGNEKPGMFICKGTGSLSVHYYPAASGAVLSAQARIDQAGLAAAAVQYSFVAACMCCCMSACGMVSQRASSS